jgi:MYXO-CTERM domain-containing protein
MRGALRALVIAGTLIAAFVSARPARAYVHSVIQVDGKANPLYWASSCETVTIYLNGFSAMTPDEVAKSIGGAAAAWGPNAVTCPTETGDGGNGHPFFEILPQLSTGGSVPAVVNDGKNSIIFDTLGSDLGPEVLAFTSVSKEPNGHIVDADIEINAGSPDILWANLDPGTPPATNGQLRFDLQTVMTHEFGHFLGLAHTCVTTVTGGYTTTVSSDSDSPPPGSKDDSEQLIPDCTDPPEPTNATQAEAVMWYVIDQESITKRVLTADDARGVCAIYPAASDPHSCTQNLPDDGCGCAAAGASTGDVATFVLVLLALTIRRRRTS